MPTLLRNKALPGAIAKPAVRPQQPVDPSGPGLPAGTGRGRRPRPAGRSCQQRRALQIPACPPARLPGARSRCPAGGGVRPGPGAGEARARVRISGSYPPHALRVLLSLRIRLPLPEPCPHEVSGDQVARCADPVPGLESAHWAGARGQGAARVVLAPAGPETLAATPRAPGLGKEALALDLDRRMWAKPEGQGPVPSPPVLAAPLGWEGVGDGLATASLAEELWKGWLGGRGHLVWDSEQCSEAEFTPDLYAH
ncbi:hypothetical protein ACRRTK_011995 [Alexandromys fortis]